MSNVSATSRRVVRTLAHREIDWSREVWKLTPRTSGRVMQFRAWVGAADVMAEKYAQPPPPVDFASAKSKIKDAALVDALESFYKANKPPPETYTRPAVDEAEQAETLAIFEQSGAFDSELKAVVANEIEFMKENRTTKDTTIHDFKLNYPMVAEEIEDEIEKQEWFKDVGLGSS